VGDLLVLCYHGISESWPAVTSVKPGDFESQLEAFLERGYRPATLSAALEAPPAPKTFVVSFDDAHRSVHRLAAPVMARLGVPGTVYAPTDYVDSGRPMAWEGYDIWQGTEHEAELECMGWEELRELAEVGWEVGSHTCSHPRLSRLGEPEIATELRRSREVCEKRMERPCESLAYPYSDFDDRAMRAAGAAGYRFAASVPRVPAAPLPLRWPRVGVYHGESAKQVRMRAWSRRLGPSSSARAALGLRRLLR
jgi:peptidoglycan/xylan/chitin deacetylase (PgdA/CDA1 family)